MSTIEVSSVASRQPAKPDLKGRTAACKCISLYYLETNDCFVVSTLIMYANIYTATCLKKGKTLIPWLNKHGSCINVPKHKSQLFCLAQKEVKSIQNRKEIQSAWPKKKVKSVRAN